MSVINTRIAPIFNEVFTITSVWWEEPRNHRGLDISTGRNSNLYSMCNGTVVFSGAERDGQGNLSGYGYYIILKENSTNMGFLYAHMRDQSSYNVGDTVRFGDIVGIEGTTGDSTGIHLHLEMQDLTNHNWIYGAPKEYYTNPATFMGIPNVEGTEAIYNYNPQPIIHKTKNNKFPWVLYARKLRGEKL